MTLIDIFFSLQVFFLSQKWQLFVEKTHLFEKSSVFQGFFNKKIKEQKFSIKNYIKKNICRSKLQTLWEDVGKLL